MFHGFIVINMKIMAELSPSIQIVNLFQDVRISQKFQIRKSRESRIRNSRKSGIRKSCV
jgi:hypothetical protein